jgi:hypothetical protein
MVEAKERQRRVVGCFSTSCLNKYVFALMTFRLKDEKFFPVNLRRRERNEELMSDKLLHASIVTMKKHCKVSQACWEGKNVSNDSKNHHKSFA